MTSSLKDLNESLAAFLVALRQVLARNPGEQSEVVIEVDQALEVQRVVQRGTGGCNFSEAIERGNGLGFSPPLYCA